MSRCNSCHLTKRDKVLVISNCHGKKKVHKVRLDEFACLLYKFLPPIQTICLKPIIGDVPFISSVSVTYNMVQTGGPDPQIGCIVTSINGDHIGTCSNLDDINGCNKCSSNKNLNKQAFVYPDSCSDVDNVPNFVSCNFIWAQSTYDLAIDWTPKALNQQIIVNPAFIPEGQTKALSTNLPPNPTNTNLDVKLRTENLPTFFDANSIQIKKSDTLPFDTTLNNLEVSFGDNLYLLDTSDLSNENMLTYHIPPLDGFSEIKVKGSLQTSGLNSDLLGISVLLGNLNL